MSEQHNTSGVSADPPTQGVGGATANASFKQLAIELKKCSGLPLGRQRSGRRRRYFVVIQSSDPDAAREQKSARLKDFEKSGSISWPSQDIFVDCTEASTISFQVIEVHIFTKKVIRRADIQAATLLKTLSLPVISGNGRDISDLYLSARISRENEELAGLQKKLPITITSASNTAVTTIDDAGTFVSALAPVANASWTFLDKIEFVMKAVDKVSELHPYASIAWSVVGAAYKVVKAQRDRDEKINELLGTLQTTFDLINTSNERMPSMLPTQQKVLTSLMKQTSECGYFIIDYVRKGFWCHAVQDMVSKTDGAIDDYCRKIRDLRAAFLNQVAVGTQVLVKLTLDNTESILAAVGLAIMPRSTDVGWRWDKQCLSGTRTKIISEIINWATLSESDAPRTLLLIGHPGTGKSSIAHTVARELDELSRLATMYCFDRNKPADRRPELLLPTLALGLAKFHASFKAALSRSVDLNDPSTTDLIKQFEHFLQQPLSEVDRSKGSLVGPIVIVIEALDESSSYEGRSALIEVLSNKLHLLRPTNVRFIVTSRPEPDILCAFDNARYVRVLSLNNKNDDVLSDMTAYVGSLLVNRNKVPLSPFTAEDYRIVAARAEGLFQWAFLVCHTVTRSRFGATDQEMHENYKKLMSVNTGHDALDYLYVEILSDIFTDEDGKCEVFRRMFGRILAADEPISFEIISILLQLSQEEDRQCRSVLSQLGTLVTGATDHHEPIHLLHSSFRDFLREESRSGTRFHADEYLYYDAYSSHCLNLLNSKLRFNICDLKTSFALNMEIPDLGERVQDIISPSLSYAARFVCKLNWPKEATGDHEVILGNLTDFLCTKFLFWLEVLSLINAMAAAERFLDMAYRAHWTKSIHNLLVDCHHIVKLFFYPMKCSVPHVYLSAYALCPVNTSMHKQAYSQHVVQTAHSSGPATVCWPQVIAKIRCRIPVCSVSFSPNSYEVAIGLSSGMISVYEIATGTLTGSLIGKHIDKVNSIAFSFNGNWIISGSTDRRVCLWNMAIVPPRGTLLKRHTASVNSVTFAPNGLRAASGSQDRTICIWDVDTQAKLGVRLKGHTKAVNCVLYSMDEAYIVSGSDDSCLCLWDMKNMTMIWKAFSVNSAPVLAVAFSSVSHSIISCSFDGTLQSWDLRNGTAIGPPLQKHQYTAHAAAFSPEGTHVALCSNQLIYILDAKSGKAVGEPLDGHSHLIEFIAFSPDGSYLISGSPDQTAQIWDIRSNTYTSSELAKGHTSWVSSIAFSPDGQYIASGSHDKTLCLWNAESGSLLSSTNQQKSSAMLCVTFFPDGLYMVSGSADKSLCIWDVQTMEPVGSPLEGHTDKVNCVAISPNGALIASGSDDMTLCIWNRKYMIGSPIKGHDGPIESVAFSPDGSQIVSGSQDATIRIWNVETRESIGRPLEGHQSGVTSVLYSPYGSFILSGSFDGTICIWDVEAEVVSCSMLLNNAYNPVWSIAMSSEYIISGSHDGTVRLWDSTTRELIATLQGHAGSVMSVALSHDLIASGSFDRSIRVWSISSILEDNKQSYSFSPEPSHALRNYPCLLPGTNTKESSASKADFRLMPDGWISDVSVTPHRLLLWIPPDARRGLYMPHTKHVINRYIHSLDLSNFAHGARWTECWKGDLTQSTGEHDAV